MAQSEKDRVAREVADLRISFNSALSNKRKYPVAEFNAFVQSARRYIKITATDPMIHKSVAQAVNGLSARGHLQASLKQRVLLKNGSTWFWNRSATALVWAPG